MARGRIPPPAESFEEDEQEAILAANRAFYVAFSSRDFEALAEMWATSVPVACVHPGQPALLDRESVLRSWQAILRNPNAPKAGVSDEFVIMRQGLAIVICRETLPGGQLLATNGFVREGEVWKIVHHHAAPAPPATTPPPPQQRDRRKLH
ncbi:MAG: nuclear transport factor 2 family protein [Alphaproteobacteria bacterium]|nr:nuclear transport factor 2 family protein [Alphaproteobacteria bacterium]